MFGGKIGIPELLVMLVLFALFPLVVAAWWRIFSKAGHPGALSLTMLVPLISFFVFLWFAFSDWPIQKRLPPEPISPK